MILVLIGPPAAGKSRIGKRIARVLGVPFVDTDVEVVREHGPISEIFANEDEKRFRQLERAAVERALQSERAVVAFGGGAVLDARTQADLAREDVAVVLMTVSPDAVAPRLASGKRPLVRSLESWQAVVDARRELYARLADRTWDTSHRPTQSIAHDIAEWAATRQERDSIDDR